MKKNQQGFTLIELMIVVAIIGILAAVAIPAYQEYVATSSGGGAMKGLGGYVAKVQTCVQTDIGCDTLNAEISSDGDVGSSVTVARDTAVNITYTKDSCIVTAAVTATGGVTYTAVASGSGATTPQCEEGAGI